jgi:hypothetical protein
VPVSDDRYSVRVADRRRDSDGVGVANENPGSSIEHLATGDQPPATADR